MQDSQPKGLQGERFPRQSRLLSGREFTRVFDKAKSYRAQGYTLLVRNNPGLGPRLGMVVGKKKLKLAVDRNLFKRLVRDSFRRHRDSLPDIDLVVIARPLSRENISNIPADLVRHWHTIAKAVSKPSSNDGS